MKGSETRIRVERLVLEGFPALDEDRLRAALASELRSLVAGGALPARSKSVDRIRIPDAPAQSVATPEAAAAYVASHVLRSVAAPSGRSTK